jgi:hypothetical protein
VVIQVVPGGRHRCTDVEEGFPLWCWYVRRACGFDGVIRESFIEKNYDQKCNGLVGYDRVKMKIKNVIRVCVRMCICISMCGTNECNVTYI